jgi:quercetin dioxygenase-like cupin family protein
MKKNKIKVAFSDNRGEITDLLQKENINAVTHITIKKGAVRGNHYHKKTIQWNYVLSGKLKLVTQFKGKKKKSIIMNKGDLIASEPMESHALVGVTNCEFLVFTKGPRGGKEYENDTFRLQKKLA